MTGAFRGFGLSILTLTILGGCAATPSSDTQQTQVTTQASTQVALATPPSVDQPLTLKQIMANPDWMGILAKGEYWSDDSQSVYFARREKRRQK